MTDRKKSGKPSPINPSSLNILLDTRQEQKIQSTDTQILQILREISSDIKLLNEKADNATKERQQMTSRMQNMETALSALQEQLAGSKKELREVKLSARKMDIEMGQIKTQLHQTQSSYSVLEESILKQELYQASYIIRIQNFPENPQEDFETILTDWMAKEADISVKELKDNIEQIYRTGMARARSYNIPREIIIRFESRKFRNQMLKTLEEKDRFFEDKKVNILREIPWKVRKKRQPYKMFAALLRKNQILYRWNLPEGMSFTYKTRRFNINSPSKVQAFLEKFGEQLGATDIEIIAEEVRQQQHTQGKEKKDDSQQIQEESSSEDSQGTSQDQEEGTDTEELGAAAPRPQRSTRVTRNKTKLRVLEYKNQNK